MIPQVHLKDDVQLTALHQALEKVTQHLESLEVQIQQGSLPSRNQLPGKRIQPFPARRSQYRGIGPCYKCGQNDFNRPVAPSVNNGNWP